MLLLGLSGCGWQVKLEPRPARTVPERIAYAAIVYEDGVDWGIRACANAACLRLWPEHTDRVEDRFRVIDADGVRYRIRDYKLAQETPGVLSRVFNATVFSTLHFRMDFGLEPDGLVPPRLVWSILYARHDDLREARVDQDTPLPRMFAALLRR